MTDRPSLLSRAFVLSCVAVSLGALAPNLFIVLPRHLRAHGLEEAAMGVVMGAFGLASLVTMPFMARLADRRGRRFPVVAGLLVTAAASAAFEAVHTTAGFAVARFVSGVGWAAVLVGAGIYATELAPPGRLGQALGVAGILTLAAMAVGPTVGELIVKAASFTWMFRVSAALCLVAALIGLALPDRPGGPRPSAAGSLVVIDGNTWRVVLATFLAASGFGANVSFLADMTSQRGLGSVAPFFNAYVVMAISSRLFLGTLSDRLGRHPVIIPALMAQVVSLTGLALVRSAWVLVPLGLLFGVAHGLSYPAMQALIVERAPPPMRAAALATSNFAFAGGITAAALACGWVAQRAGYAAAYFLCASLLVASIAVVVSDRTAAITAD